MRNKIRWRIFTITCAFKRYRFRIRKLVWYMRNDDHPPANEWLEMMDQVVLTPTLVGGIKPLKIGVKMDKFCMWCGVHECEECDCYE